jgi:hypothetical protein
MIVGGLAAGVIARAEAQDSTIAMVSAEAPTAPVLLDGTTLFSVRCVSSYPAELRAADISHRIAEFAANRSVPAESLAIQETRMMEAWLLPAIIGCSACSMPMPSSRVSRLRCWHRPT